MEIILVIVLLYVLLGLFRKSRDNQTTAQTISYLYKPKGSVMTPSENEFFDVLLKIVNSQYYVFPQIHLSSILDHKINGQSWKGAWGSIQQKSVDFTICDTRSRLPILVIELDDMTHDRDDRKLRDMKVDQVFEQAGLPILHFRTGAITDYEQVKSRIAEKIPLVTSQ